VYCLDYETNQLRPVNLPMRVKLEQVRALGAKLTLTLKDVFIRALGAK